MKTVQSRDNATYRRLRDLAEDGRFRREQGASLLDGVHLVLSAIEAKVSVRLVAVTFGAMSSPEVIRILDALPADCKRIVLADSLMRQISPVETPTGIVAEIAIPVTNAAVQGSDTLLLEAVQDAGNLGTLLRTAAAAGLRRVALTEHCAQAWSPKVLRAGMGAHFLLQIIERCDPHALLDGWSGPVIATSLDKRAQNLFSLGLQEQVIWMFGSEGQGLSARLLSRATHLARIPMPGGAESLNVAAAAAVCLFEQVRQRQG